MSASPDRFSNASTARTRSPGAAGAAVLAGTTGAVGAAGEALPSAATLATTCRQPTESVSPVHLDRSAHWIWSNGMGRRARSTVSWTSLRATRAISASDLTHSDFAASADQITTTDLAACSRSSMTSA